jgi:acyl dehydratase
MCPEVSIDQLKAAVGEEVGVSDWFVVDQDRIDTFADATLDHQYIHVDPEMAAGSPWGTTIAHGFLTLSLSTYLVSGIRMVPVGTATIVNYGSERVRYLQPVKSGDAIRARVLLKDVSERSRGRYLVTNEVTIEIDGQERPAMVAEILTLFLIG